MAFSLGSHKQCPILIDDETENQERLKRMQANNSSSKDRENPEIPSNDALSSERMIPDSTRNIRQARIIPLLSGTSRDPQNDNDMSLSDDTIDSTNDLRSSGTSFKCHSKKAANDSEIERSMNWVDIYDPNGLNLRKNVVVELDDNDFLKIALILQCPKSGNVFLRGNRFRRTRYMDGMFDTKMNEVCWIQELDDNNNRTPEIQSMVTVPIEQAMKRRKLRFTNQLYPALSFRSHGEWPAPRKSDPEKQKVYNDIQDNAPLTCRMKFVCYFRDTTARLRGNSYETAIFFLRQNECDGLIDNNIRDTHLRQTWRGETSLGGSQVGFESGEKEFLRQEAVSHGGKPCHNSLIISGRQYAAGDVMERGTVADLLIREDESGIFFTKLSGINDNCFVRSWLNVKTGEEFQNEQETDDELGRKIGHAVRSVFEADNATPQPNGPQCQDLQPCSIFAHQVQGQITTENSKSQKRTASIAFASSNNARKKSITTSFLAKKKPSQRRYTFGDCFCGAGGMSRAAIQAGVRVKWAFDFNDLACFTYALNFHTALVYHEDAHTFATSYIDQKCDICHMSPPCQYFSPAHTRIGKDDDVNTASLFAVGMLLDKTRCRIATLEQTAGLLTRHQNYFNACVREFTHRGFSVRWKLLKGADFGLPQRRNRLFMIASCPGELLPPFPTATHTRHTSPSHPHLKPWTTINQALRSIPPDWPNHAPHLLPHRPGPPPPPGAGDTVANCIMTGGGDNTLHPDGGRCYTHRELACLQGFPLGHKFGGGNVRAQIGNAVAPVVGRRVLEEIIKALRKVDEMEEREKEVGEE